MKTLFNLFLCSCLVLSCAKDKTPIPVASEPEIDSRDIFLGDYKVYNSNGNHLYDIRITKNNVEGNCTGPCDSLFIENFAGKFDVGFWNSRYNTDYNYFSFQYDSITDYDGYSWSVFVSGDETYNAYPKNDTILLKFQLSNIQYYLQEGQLYFDCVCEHIAVKQH